ncbi:MAG: indolepyruvate ferredoxin oxidoreductase subunit alpha [Coriobacteriia bacterium]|nr:indolepyruvate ferredoxin oxidoreductase subunit alpha [Coriobacteriia bacterium]MBN2847958.1 indolepyruvate ferredoxin oxidoreductase subunit alpha [Coriobacteriia bacterium]
MSLEFLMGNHAIAAGAIRAGVGVVTGYPGTPSSEILETVVKRNPGDIYAEWSVNEKVALEVAAGAAYAGVRSMVTMKQVGLNVASDPLMSLAYIGVKGGMVVVVADDPGPISSQTEQDTRTFAVFAKLPVFDPASPEEAYEMIQDAFELSERLGTPVLFRPTTRVCHGYAPIEVGEWDVVPTSSGFEKGSRWVIFPRLSYANHRAIEERLPQLGEELSAYRFNTIEEVRGGEVAGTPVSAGDRGIATGGVSHAYVSEALAMLGADCRLFKVGTPHPLPAAAAREFLAGLDEVLVIEELDPVIERELLILAGEDRLGVTISGKRSGHTERAGENTVESVAAAIAKFLGMPAPIVPACSGAPTPPARPPVLCAGCPHRASFYAVKRAMRGRKAVFSGDIGCYTLGNAAPLEMVDTCLCMGAGVTIAQGLERAEPDATHFAFIGDSTFFHTGIPGVVNAVYNGTDIVLVVLDNSTTAMTGHQTHPGLGRTAQGEVAAKIAIAPVLASLGVSHIETCDPMQLAEAEAAVKRAVEAGGVSAIIFESPCIAVTVPGPMYEVDAQACTDCQVCIQRLGCPAIVRSGGVVSIDTSLCYGCSICAQVCPTGAIGVAR